MIRAVHDELAALRRSRDTWVGFTVCASILVCAAVALMYVLQAAAFDRAADLARQLRQARIDLHQGFMHAMLGAAPDSPWDRTRGLVLMEQAIREFRGALPRAPDAAVTSRMEGGLRRLEEVLARGTAANRDLIELRVSFYRLDRFASEMDTQAAHELRQLRVRQAVTFWIVLAGSAVLLVIVIAGTARAALRERAAVQGQHESEMRFSDLADNIDAVFWVRDPRSGRILYVSAAYERLWGQVPQALFQDPHAWMGALVEEDRVRMSQRVVQQTDGTFDEEYRIVRPDGGVRWIHDRAFAARDARGEVYRAVGIAVDVTERKLAQERMAESERRLRWVMDLVPNAIYAKDADGRYLLANQAAADLLGCAEPGELLGRRAEEFGVDPQHAEEDRRSDRQVIATGQRFAAAVARRTIAGATFALVINKRPFAFSGATPDSVLGVATDVTALKRAQEELQRTVVLLEATLQGTDNGVMAAGPHGEVLLWNERLVQLLGSAAPLQRRSESAVLQAIGVDAPGDAAATELPVVASDTGRWLEVHGQPMMVEGRAAGRVWTFRDVTARERALEDAESRERELQERVDVRTRELADAVRELEAFTGAVSHDLRAPLAAIRAFAEVVLRKHGDALPPQGRHYLERVFAASENMREMIEGLLQLARHARAPVHCRPLDLSRMAREAHALLAPSCAGRQVEFVVADGMHASGDPVLVATLLQNLIGNALKYSRDRQPARVEVGAASDGDGPHFYVRDNGAGFDPAYADRLFKPFSRLHTSDEFEGHGIGLATTSRIVARHGGRIWAEGEVDRGATFRFTLG